MKVFARVWKLSEVLGGTGLFVLSLAFISPMFFVLLNTFRSETAFLKSYVGWPGTIKLDNYVQAFIRMDFGRVFLNSAIVSGVSLAVLVIFASMAAYKLARVTGVLSSLMFAMYVVSLVVPQQGLMIPTVVTVSRLHLLNSLTGLMLVNIAVLSPVTVFMYHGFVKSIPREMEESAFIDGANPYQSFFLVVFPLLQPATATIVVLMGLASWNQFLLPLLLTNEKAVYTLPLSLMYFFRNYDIEWTQYFAAVTIAATPVVILFFSLQRFVTKGIAAGAVKG